MGCTDCTKAYALIELPVGSSKNSVKSARKEWSKNLHPDIWQNRPGWKGAANQLTNINVAIDHLLQCDGSSYTSAGANANSVSEAEVQQVLRRATEALRQAKGDMRQHAWKTRTKGWIMFAGFCVLFVLPLFLYSTTTLFSPGQVDASNQEPTSFTPQSVVPKSDASPASPAQPASVMEIHPAEENDVEQPEAIPVASSPSPVSPAAPAAPAMPDEAQLRVEVSPRPAYVPAATKAMEDPVVPDMAPTIRNPYGFAPRTAPVGYAAMQVPKAQPTSRATILILSNGSTAYVTNVWYSGEQIMFTMPDGSHRSLGLEQVNFRSTIQANQQTGVGFHPPKSYPGN